MARPEHSTAPTSKSALSRQVMGVSLRIGRKRFKFALPEDSPERAGSPFASMIAFLALATCVLKPRMICGGFEPVSAPQCQACGDLRVECPS